MRPLEPGDPIHMAVEAHPTVLAGKPGDLVLIGVPEGKGLMFAEWVKRQALGDPASQAAHALELIDEVSA